MKTIFITSLNPFVTRNILQTNVFKVLRENKNLRVVIFCPDFKADYFKNNFDFPNVLIEPVSAQVSSFQDNLFKYAAAGLLDNRTRYIHQRRELSRNKKLFRFLFSRILAKLGHFNLIKNFVRRLDRLTVSKEKYARFFEKYRPDLVFCPDVFHDDDVRVLAEAGARGVFAVGMVRSWDNITNKGMFRIKPDLLLVNNEIIKEEAVKYGAMKTEDIKVVGMPQFDGYATEPRSSRDEFFKRINLDPQKRLVMFSPHGVRFHDTDWHIMQILKDARAKGEIPLDVQVLVRFPPNDDVSLGNFEPDEYFFIDQPAKWFKGGLYRDQELDKKAMAHLADSLFYSELLITYNSSLIIDAAAFGKPSIGVAFDGFDKKPNIFESVARFMEYDHTQHLLKTGGFWVARLREELIKAVNTYLQNPSYNLENRRKIAETQIDKLDGKSGEKIANFLISKL